MHKSIKSVYPQQFNSWIIVIMITQDQDNNLLLSLSTTLQYAVRKQCHKSQVSACVFHFHAAKSVQATLKRFAEQVLDFCHITDVRIVISSNRLSIAWTLFVYWTSRTRSRTKKRGPWNFHFSFIFFHDRAVLQNFHNVFRFEM